MIIVTGDDNLLYDCHAVFGMVADYLSHVNDLHLEHTPEQIEAMRVEHHKMCAEMYERVNKVITTPPETT